MFFTISKNHILSERSNQTLVTKDRISNISMKFRSWIESCLKWQKLNRGHCAPHNFYVAFKKFQKNRNQIWIPVVSEVKFKVSTRKIQKTNLFVQFKLGRWILSDFLYRYDLDSSSRCLSCDRYPPLRFLHKFF